MVLLDVGLRKTTLEGPTRERIDNRRIFPTRNSQLESSGKDINRLHLFFMKISTQCTILTML